jgi:hypothetical protein
MKRVLVLAAVGEGATGLALLIVPSLVGRLLFHRGGNCRTLIVFA